MLAKLFSLLKPIPLAFFIFPFSFAAQVVYGNVVFGALPYAFIIIGIAGLMLKASIDKNNALYERRLNYLDYSVLYFILFSMAHICYGVLVGGYILDEGIRLFLIYVLSSWIYFYFARYATEDDIRAALFAIAVSSVILGVHWFYETINKIAFGQISDFQKMAAEYRGMRRGVDETYLNIINVIKGYVTFGLSESHTVAGATVATGAFAILASSHRLAGRQVGLLISVFPCLLALAGAKTAFVIFVVMIPIVFRLLEYDINVRVWISFLCGLLLIIIVFGALMSRLGWYAEFVSNRTDILHRSIAGLLRLSKDSHEGISWLWLYAGYLKEFIFVCTHRPFVILFGQGPQPFGKIVFAQGGDVAILEFVSKYGVPMSFFLVLSWTYALTGAIKKLIKEQIGIDERRFLFFGACTVFFLLFSLLHYDDLFRKSIIVIFWLALGLIRRYSSRSARSRLYSSVSLSQRVSLPPKANQRVFSDTLAQANPTSD